MFNFHVPTKILFSQGNIGSIGELVKEYGDKVLLVTDDATAQESGHITKIKQAVEREVFGLLSFNKVTQDANSDLVNEGADQARHAQCNVIIGFGRKTTLNIAKAIAFLCNNSGTIEEYFLGRKPTQKKLVHYIEIPTGVGLIPGITNEFFIFDKYDKVQKSLSSATNYADAVLYDGKITSQVPANYTALQGIGMISLCVEAYISKAATAMSDPYALRAIEFIGQNLVKAVQDNEAINLRMNLCTGAIMGTIALSHSAPGITHALSLALQSIFGVYSGIVSAILLPQVMEFNLTSVPQRYVSIAKAFGEQTTEMTVVEAAIKSIESIRKILFNLKVPQKLSELTIDKGKFYDAAALAKGYDFLHYLPRAISKDDLYNILTSAY